MICVAKRLPGVQLSGPEIFALLIAAASPRVYNTALSFGDLNRLLS